MFRCFSAAFDRLGTQWRLCTQTDTSDGDHGSLAVFLQRVGDATTSEPVAFALRVVADDGDQVSTIHHDHVILTDARIGRGPGRAPRAVAELACWKNGERPPLQRLTRPWTRCHSPANTLLIGGDSARDIPRYSPSISLRVTTSRRPAQGGASCGCTPLSRRSTKRQHKESSACVCSGFGRPRRHCPRALGLQ
jgi:hypothetical protein